MYSTPSAKDKCSLNVNDEPANEVLRGVDVWTSVNVELILIGTEESNVEKACKCSKLLLSPIF